MVVVAIHTFFLCEVMMKIFLWSVSKSSYVGCPIICFVLGNFYRPWEVQKPGNYCPTTAGRVSRAENIQFPCDTATPLCSVYARGLKTRSTEYCTGTLRAALFTTAKQWNDPSVHRWTKDKQDVVSPYNGVWFGHKKKRSIVLTHTAMGMNLENVTLGKRRRMWKDEGCMIQLLWNT